jgi:hypothetical protein
MDTILSVVIVEYNSIPETRSCIASLKTHIQVPYEIIISSNSCYSQQQKAQIATDNDNVRWLFNERNGGFAYAMNEGLKVAKGKYLVIMNSDCTIEMPLDGMIEFMDAHPETGAIAPMMKDKDGNIQDTARPYVTLPRYVWRQVKRITGHRISILDTKMDYNAIQTVDWVIGAFIMVSRRAYELTDGLDEAFFMYAEDLDWCTRIRQKGLEVVYYPPTVILYKGTRRARNNSKYAKIFIKSHLYYWKKFGFFYGYPKRRALVV